MRNLIRSSLPILFAVAFTACGVEPSSDLESQDPELETMQQGLTSVANFGSNPGGLKMYTYIPSGMPAKAPLVLALHGCTMGAADYVNAGWNQLADKWKFYVVYPESSSGVRCFLWYELAHNKRGFGEAASLKSMVDHMKASYGIDDSRVFITGLSAGGGMVATMLAAYPDVFAAGAPMAGLPYRCADSIGDSGACMGSGKAQPARTWGDLVRGAYPGFNGPWPRISIWQGASDYTVSTANAAELMKQWTDVHGIDQSADASGRVDTASHAEYRDASGRTLVETWMVDAMGHGVAVKPGFQPAGGCGQAGNFVFSAGTCSTYYAARFFGLDPEDPIEPGDAGTNPPPAGADAGVQPPPAGPDASVPPPPPCNDWNTNNYKHVQEGRAATCGDYSAHACAVGSNDDLGLYSLGIITWVRQVAPGYFELGKCEDVVNPPPAGPDAGTEPPPAGPDASVEPPPAGADAGTEPPPPGPDAASEPPPAGPDAASEPPPAGADAGTQPPPAGPDASAQVVPGPDAHVPGPLEPPATDGGTVKRPDGGPQVDPGQEFWGCGTPGASLPWMAPFALLLLLRRRHTSAHLE